MPTPTTMAHPSKTTATTTNRFNLSQSQSQSPEARGAIREIAKTQTRSQEKPAPGKSEGGFSLSRNGARFNIAPIARWGFDVFCHVNPHLAMGPIVAAHLCSFAAMMLLTVGQARMTSAPIPLLIEHHHDEPRTSPPFAIPSRHVGPASPQPTGRRCSRRAVQPRATRPAHGTLPRDDHR